MMFKKVLLAAVVVGGFSLANVSQAEARNFGTRGFYGPSVGFRTSGFRSSGFRSAGFRGRSFRGSSFRLRGPSPLPFHVSRAKYKRLTTFYPGIYRRY